ncbi:MAG: hypothetical protein ABI130_03280 [Leifsonia sp.]
MSTVDPTSARRERANRRPSTVRVVVVLVLLLVGGTMLGFGWGGFGRMIDATTGPTVAITIAIPAGMILTIGSSIAWAQLVVKRSDVGGIYGTAAAILGAGVGVLIVSRDQNDNALPTLIGLGLLGLAVLCLILGLSAAAARRREASAQAETMRTGRVTQATVSDRGYHVFHESDRIFTTVTFTFTDLQGVQRWVQRPMLIHAADPIEATPRPTRAPSTPQPPPTDGSSTSRPGPRASSTSTPSVLTAR